MGYRQVQVQVKRIPLGVKIAYGGAEGASSLAFTVLAIYYLIFLTHVAGINPATAGAIQFGVNLWDVVTRARHRALVEAIEARQRGEYRALDDFEDIL